VLGRSKVVNRVAPQDVQEILFLLSTQAERVIPGAAPITVRDPKDQDVLGAALSGRVDYLVTGDSDLLVLDGDARLDSLRIVTVAEYFRLTSS
jgi:putative PIN family toxin of toxin-antitoxin system